MNRKPEEADADFARIVEDNKRGVNDFFDWRDKTTKEHDIANEALRGLRADNLRPGSDPPDCEGTIDGARCAIEVTELVHEKTLKRSIKAIKQREVNKEPGENSEAYFAWDRNDLVNRIQALINNKDEKLARTKDGPYDRYILVVHCDEMFLNISAVKRLTAGVVFLSKLINDLFLLLSNEPAMGRCPVLQLPLSLVEKEGSW
jgi:hypothetical protein